MNGIFLGYKPLTFLNGELYLYSDGKLWVCNQNEIKECIRIVESSWKDKNRFLIRIFRREPKIAIPIDDYRIIIAGYRKIFLVDVKLREKNVIYKSREKFSDPLNICKAEKNWLAIWGDYGSNKEREAINIYGLKSNLRVETIYRFQSGQIRHIHNIVPKITGGYYIFTGDKEDEAGIYIADVDLKKVQPIKVGKQQYRAVVGFDTPNGLLYATDAVDEKNYVYLMKDDELKMICHLNGSCIYGTKYKGAYYFATTVEPDESQKGIISWISRRRGKGILSTDVTLVKVNTDLKVEEIARYQKDNWPMKLMQYGSIQFPHTEGEELWIYPVAVKKWDGKAIRIQ